ncbi:MFS transporter [Salinibacterium hongtaonis]|uniref:MFS transporter n=1 Tax=Homoserinimonas hongtaonis TaxID=2079791 RepID=UPI000D3930EC|nr:MFS transporter [Salinibacterium hongtaonis]AWB90150.1 MFS transporter [Salinibacterium hongtaonis]
MSKNSTAFLALLGIVLLALNMRAVLGNISPIVVQISRDIPLSSAALAILGGLPPVVFAVSGLLVPLLSRVLRIEALILFSLGLIVLGNVGRGLAADLGSLMVATGVVLAGIGVANVLLPALVKKYFPSHIVLVTAFSMSTMAIGTSAPAISSHSLTEALGWQFALGVWAAFAAVALVPWILLAARARRDGSATIVHLAGLNRPRVSGNVARSRTAWALLLVFALAQVNIYAMFAWLPTVLVDTAGMPWATTGVMLGVYALMGVVASVLVATFARRMRNPSPLMYVGIACFSGGYGGLLLAPTAAPWLWVALAGVGPTVMHICLMLVGLRSRTHDGAVALSSFMQGFGYAAGAAGPLVMGLLHGLTDGWALPLVLGVCTALVMVLGVAALRKDRFVEDEWARRN